jgi:transcription elongation factor Elf1
MHSDYNDTKFLNLLSSQLEQFKKKGDTLYNFRCPYCGDSQTNKNKARGYVFQVEGNYIFKCHNCGQGASLPNLIKHVNPQLHKQYVLEKFGDKNKPKEVSAKTDTSLRFKKKPAYQKTALKDLKKISQLRPDHPAKLWVEKRQIPKATHYKLYFAPKFYEFAKKFAPTKYGDIKKDEPRLIIPFVDANGELIAFQGRAFGKTDLRYITVKVNEEAPKIFGLDTIDRTKPVYIVEGPIDSLFLDNACAMAGSGISNESIGKIGTEDIVFVFDNEPRNKEIVGLIEKRINTGYKVVVFPDYIEEKDINDMVLAGREVEEIQSIISNNVFNGLGAKTRLSEWRKI